MRKGIRASVVGIVMILTVSFGVVSTETAASADTSVGTSFTNGLYPDQYIHSPNWRYRFIMQTDGNLVLYDGNRACWGSGTVNTPGAYAYLVITPWYDPYTNYLVVRDQYNNELRRYLAATKNGTNVNVNNNGEVWITAKKFISC